MVFEGRDGRKDSGRPLATLFYRDYIISTAWELRKKQYYERHAKVCKICGATTNVQLNHIKYGNYGRELDRDLVPLCGMHHQALHDKLGVRKNMHYQTEYFLADMIAEWDAEHESPTASSVQSSVASENALTKAIDAAARPIWKLIAIVTFRT